MARKKDVNARDRKRRKKRQLDMVIDGRSTRDLLAPLARKSPPARATISKSVIHRLKIQMQPPAHILEQVDALASAGKINEARRILAQWWKSQERSK